MPTKLQKYFPMLRNRDEILKEIDANVKLTDKFYSWKEAQRQEFLDICTGARGIKMLYDSFFKEVMNPETVPERLEEFLEVLLGEKVKIVEVLPGDSTRLADEQSLLIMDILVRFEDGTYCNIEVQKIGYAFPGERSACYSSDLLLRQYKKARSIKKDKFSYKDVKGVYTIVLMEKSSGVFHKYPEEYVHIFQQKSNSGLVIDLLQKYVFVPLDIFRKNVDNNGIKNKLDAWLTFLGIDEPEKIIELIDRYPEFSAMYEHVYYICRNVEDIMGIFSEELKIMDRNTVKYMVDEMQEMIDEKDRQLEEKNQEIEENKQCMKEKDQKIEELEKELAKYR
nr:PD-(D/E)XK nuclease family transposase [uncultured Blautia sp.]